MEKKMWNTPVATVEQFVADEYVSACWTIACLVPQRGENDPLLGNANDPWGGTHRDGSGHCGSANSQYIQDLGNDRYKITEHSSLYGWMETEIYTPGYDYSQDNPPSKNDDGWSDWFTITKEQLEDDTPDYVYWRTDGITKSYYHYGIISLIDNARSQHS